MFDDIGMTGSCEMGILIVTTTEVRVEQRHHVVAVLHEREPRHEGFTRADVLAFEVPPAFDAAVRRDECSRRIIDGDRIPLGFVLHAEVILEVSGAQEHAGGIASVTRVLQFDKERQVGELAHIFVEVGHRAVFVELLEDDMTHRHAQCRVSTLLRCHPHVGEFRRVAVVGRDDSDLRALVAHLRIEGRVGRTCRRHVAAPEQ